MLELFDVASTTVSRLGSQADFSDGSHDVHTLSIAIDEQHMSTVTPGPSVS